MTEAAQRAEKAAEVLEQHAGAAFHAYELIFARVEEHLRAAPDEDEAHRHAYLAGIDHGLKEVGSLFLVDATGRVTAHSRFLPIKPTMVTDRDYFRMLVEKGDARPSGSETDETSPGDPLPSLDGSGLAVGKPNVPAVVLPAGILRGHVPDLSELLRLLDRQLPGGRDRL